MQRIILTIAIITVFGFSMIACGSSSNDDPEQGSDSFSSLTVHSKGIKSLYLSSVSVTRLQRAAEGDFSIPSLSYMTDNGQNAPVLFTSPSGKMYMLEIEAMEQIDGRRIAAICTGYYEVTVTEGEESSYNVGQKVDHWVFALIDMNNGKVYDFNYFDNWIDAEEGVFGHGVYFIENNIAYVGKDNVVNKVDFTAASLQAVPLNNGTFIPIWRVYPLWTIDNKVIGITAEDGVRVVFYCLDTSGNNPPIEVTGAPLPEDIFNFASDTIVPPALRMDFNAGIFLQDLSGKTWYFATYNAPYDNVSFWFGNSGSEVHYLLTELNIDNDGKFKASNLSSQPIPFDVSNENYRKDDNYNFLFFYINAAGVGTSQYEFIGRYWHQNRQAFLHNGVVIINTNGFVTLTKTKNGIDVKSVSLNLPKFDRALGQAAINADNYLYWIDGKSIKRIKLESGATQETIFASNRIIANPTTARDWITVSGSNIIFYMTAEGSATAVHTYVLDMNSPLDPPQLLATTDINIKAIAELDF